MSFPQLPSSSLSPPEKKDRFSKFLRKEYDNIAQAHFKTTEMISEYVKHYLTIVAVPFTVLVVISNLDAFKSFISNGNLMRPALLLLALLFGIISIVGLMFFWYILNLRWDALLYARTINAIRKYFYDHNQTLDKPNNYRTRVLPQSPYTPGYREFGFFGPLVFVFTIINSMYFYIAAIGLEFSLSTSNPFESRGVVYTTALFFVLHIFLYLYLAQYREFQYLQSTIIGVDIDGVLNNQRDHFCKYLEKNAGIKIDPNKIIKIPVHDCIGLGVTRADELKVFNDPEYWITLPPSDGASENIRRLKNSMKLKVHLFTSRPWPVDPSLKEKWREVEKHYTLGVNQKLSRKRRIFGIWKDIKSLFPYRIRRVRSILRRGSSIEKITKAWITEHNFDIDSLMVELGSEEVANPAAHIHNRFYASRVMGIKYFVEDDLIKAEKLSYMCDIVFLIDQPYNAKATIPANIIRVRNWDEILQHMREYS